MSQPVQMQWDLAPTFFNSVPAIRELVRACSTNDVQGQAVFAFESLGAGLLVHPTRIAEAIDALGGRRSERLDRLNLMVGLSGDGLPRTMRKSTGCVSAFTLVAACKTCYDDVKIGNILFEMMVKQGVYSNFPASPWQLSQLVSAVSGYADKIIPVDIFTSLTSQVYSRLNYSFEMPGLLSEIEPKMIADILSSVFTSLRNQEIDRITLEGSQGGMWLATVLLWLDDSIVSVSVNGALVTGESDRRIGVCFVSEDAENWVVREWRAQKDVSSLIVPIEDGYGNSHNIPLGLFPRRSAKEVLGNQHRLLAPELELTGQLAGALVTVAVERGVLISQETTSSGPHNLPRSTTTHGLPRLKLSEICQTEFLLRYGDIAKDFGWEVTDHFGRVQARIAALISAFLDERGSQAKVEHLEDHQNYLRSIQAALAQIEANENEIGKGPDMLLGNIEASNILEPSVNIAAEALYSCLYRKAPEATVTRYMRGYHYKRTMHNALVIWRIVFRPVYGSYGVSLADLRRESFNSLLSSANIGATLGDRGLILANNGYVASLNILGAPSTLARDCAAICAMPGGIHWAANDTQFVAVQQLPAEEFPARRHFSGSEPLSVFEGDQYQGLEARGDPNNYKVEYLLTSSERTLLLTTFMKGKSPEAPPVGVDWLASINAIVFAKTIRTPSVLSSFAEEQLAKAWNEQYLFTEIGWLAAGGSPAATNFKGYIAMTDEDEVLRFFAAGRFRAYKLFIRRGAPLISYISVALKRSEAEESLATQLEEVGSSFNDPQWVIIA